MIRLNRLPYGHEAKHKALVKVVEKFNPTTAEEKIICAYLLGTQNPSWTIGFAQNYKSNMHYIRFMKLENILHKL